MRVMFYDDVSIFGGHEEMTLNALRWFLSSNTYEVAFAYSRHNGRLFCELSKIADTYQDLKLIEVPYTSRNLQFFRTPFAWGAARVLRSVLQSFRPDCIVVIQGEISLSSLGAWVAKQQRIKTISYIPMAHSRHARDGGIISRIKDYCLSHFYQLPDAFITISQNMERLLRQRGVSKPVLVVKNGIDLSCLQQIDKQETRKRLHISPTAKVAALIGRVESKQKGHDILIGSLKKYKTKFAGWEILIVGDGPDRKRMEHKCQQEQLSELVRFLPWPKDLSVVYSASDLIVIPSRYEGVPLVMLQAMYSRVPIVASDCDAMQEILPEFWRFPVGDEDALAARLLEVSAGSYAELLDKNKRVVMEEYGLEAHGRAFAAAINSLISS